MRPQVEPQCPEQKSMGYFEKLPTYGGHIFHPGRLTAGTYSHHPFRKEHDLNQTSRIMFHANLQGVLFAEVFLFTYADSNKHGKSIYPP